MGRIKNAEHLDSKIDAETAWRKQELAVCVGHIKTSSGASQIANIRAGVVLLYAHWEGWVKAISRLYIRYVNDSRIPYNELSPPFLGTALKSKTLLLLESHSSRVHTDFASFILEGLGENARLNEELVRTESNLSSRVFVEILERLGLNLRTEYTLKERQIDVELVERRNKIAHGNFLDLSDDEYFSLKDGVIEILELFTADVREAAQEARHLSTHL